MARINDQEELDALLNEFEVIVIPDGEGDFAHNSAFYLVDPDGYLQDVMDFTEIEAASEKVNCILEQEEGEEIMKQAKYELIQYLFLMLPPVIKLSASIISIDMHVQ